MARAIRIGSLASAIAVFMRTPSQPSSMAIDASDAVPTPASTITGTPAPSTMIRMVTRFCKPRPDPMGAPKGMMAQQPISSRRLAIMGSSLQYTMTLKSSATRVSAALKVSVMFG